MKQIHWQTQQLMKGVEIEATQAGSMVAGSHLREREESPGS